ARGAGLLGAEGRLSQPPAARRRRAHRLSQRRPANDRGAARRTASQIHAGVAASVPVRGAGRTCRRAGRGYPAVDSSASAVHPRRLRTRDMTIKRPRRQGTLVTHLRRAPRKGCGAVSTPVFHASTILFPTVAELLAAMHGEHAGLTYGLHGLPTVTDLQNAIAELEG